MKVFLQTPWPLESNRQIVVDRFPFVIGRRKENDGTLPLACVSRRHCQLIRSGEQVIVHDLDSYNGTYVNDTLATTPMAIKNGDELKLGPCPFRVTVLRDTDVIKALPPNPDEHDTVASNPVSKHDESTVDGSPPASRPTSFPDTLP
jgi:predicted component of type VI protein secretion system